MISFLKNQMNWVSLVSIMVGITVYVVTMHSDVYYLSQRSRELDQKIQNIGESVEKIRFDVADIKATLRVKNGAGIRSTIQEPVADAVSRIQNKANPSSKLCLRPYGTPDESHRYPKESREAGAPICAWQNPSWTHSN